MSHFKWFLIPLTILAVLSLLAIFIATCDAVALWTIFGVMLVTAIILAIYGSESHKLAGTKGFESPISHFKWFLIPALILSVLFMLAIVVFTFNAVVLWILFGVMLLAANILAILGAKNHERLSANGFNTVNHVQPKRFGA